MSVPAQIAFLLTGPMLDLKLLLMYQSVFKRRAIFVLATLILTGVLAIVVGLEMIYGVFQSPKFGKKDRYCYTIYLYMRCLKTSSGHLVQFG
jgi:hypothetical protein